MKERLETSPPRADRNCMVRLSKLIVSVSLTAVTLAMPGLANASEQGEYVVVEGDTLSGIATTMGVPLGDLLQANGLAVTSVILPGHRLDVPAGTTVESAIPETAAGGKVGAVLDFALAQVGKPYEFFTAGSATFDCSGLTMSAFGRVGVPLVHHSATQAGQGSAVDYWNGPIRAGDLVFLDTDWNGVIDHVGIALNATTWVHASESRGVVLTSPMPSKSVIVAVRRFVAE